jgi:hypothetical protein
MYLYRDVALKMRQRCSNTITGDAATGRIQLTDEFEEAVPDRSMHHRQLMCLSRRDLLGRALADEIGAVDRLHQQWSMPVVGLTSDSEHRSPSHAVRFARTKEVPLDGALYCRDPSPVRGGISGEPGG